ncbi:MAG: methyltransferase domain-containing protein [Gammaproteobacteria bacterium]
MKNFHGKVSNSYLEKAAETFSTIKEQSYQRMALSKDALILDIGCGPGIDILALAKRVGMKGCLIGFDHDPNMLQQASKNVADAEVDRNITFIQGSAGELPFADASFHACRSERVFMHLTDPEKALAEMFRVTRPGGRIVVVETDWPGLSIDNSLPKIERALAEFRLSHILANGYSGRSLYRLFKRFNTADITIDVCPICITDIELFRLLSMEDAVEQRALAEKVVTERELTYWRDELKQASSNNCFFCTVNIIIISAIKRLK